jgi:hypothetical protein
MVQTRRKSPEPIASFGFGQTNLKTISDRQNRSRPP